ncbi:MAG: hypothetical protein KF832_07840 [Caldilineaceae bacterium]|nr:hypothetical protein [Caldilineaceae bacterium]
MLAGIGSGLLAYTVTEQQPPVYEASTRMIVGPGIDSLNPDLNELRTAEQLMRIYADLATTRPVLESVVEELQLPMSSDSLKKMVEVKTNTSTQILDVNIRGGDAEQVVVIANALANKILSLSPAGGGVTPAELKADIQAQIDELKTTITQNQETIKQLETRQSTIISLDERRLLLDQLSQLRTRQSDNQRTLATLYEAYQESNTNQIKIIELAVAGEEVDAKLLLTTLMAAVAGVILTLTLVLVFEFFDDTIRTITDLAYTTGIPILATLNKHKRLQGAGRDRFVVHALPDSRVAEGYRVLSSKLLLSRFQHETSSAVAIQQNYVALTAEGAPQPIEPTMRSVVISGTQANENVSEIAANLAVLLAQTGHRIILVDAYLHRPSIHRLFGLPEQRGLADILLLRNLAPRAVIRQLRHPLTKAVKEEVEPARTAESRPNDMKSDLQETAALVSVDWAPGLQILTSGAQPPNPFELLVSPHMADLIKSLEKQADLVIIAASPLLASADSLILASRADGVVIVTSEGKTRRDTLKEIVLSLQGLHANILGTILDQQPRRDLLLPVQSGLPYFTDRRERQSHSVASVQG